MRDTKVEYMLRTKEADCVLEKEGKTDTKPIEIYERLLKITGKGNHAEVKRRRDGTLVVYEVKKNIIM